MNEDVFKFIEKFDWNFITTDENGHMFSTAYLYGNGLKKNEEIIEIIETIISIKGYSRGSSNTSGKWIRKETLISILKENPSWIRSVKTARKFGI